MIAAASRTLLAWLAAAVAAYALASIAHTQTVLAGLGRLGVEVDARARLATTLGDLAGLWRYGLVIAVALGLGLAVVRIASRRPWGTAHGARRAMLAGALAIGVALVAMRLALSFTPIASARGAIGFAAQCLAGATGGLVFRACLRRLRRDPR